MPNGQGLPSGTPGLPTYQWKIPTNVNVSSANIFDLIRQAYAQMPTMTSILPFMQQQYAAQAQAVAPQLEAIRRAGEQQAAIAQSEAGARGLRGSDIEAAGMASARQAALEQQSNLLSQLAMAQAQNMAQAIMQAYGMDIQANRDLYLNLAQAIGQELSRQQEEKMFYDQLKAYEKAMKRQEKYGFWQSLLQPILTVGGIYAAGGFRK